MRTVDASALKHPLVQAPRELVTELDFNLGIIPTTVRLRLYHEIHEGHVSHEQSHLLQTPLQDEPAVMDLEDELDADRALQRLVADFVQRYQEAEQAGHRPSAGWLMPNHDFG